LTETTAVYSIVGVVGHLLLSDNAVDRET
jgi:hypothetical protein